ncbi:unnamed protein product [Schistosoma margrebowiei]|uniref:Uncharacterized protein n=1 Tax=Schistosoma margrebowiei TaxID=48269 RepID=A0A183MMR7_9TREM|nr:unnamed protein product [Schistosoma margrebowiei]
MGFNSLDSRASQCLCLHLNSNIIPFASNSHCVIHGDIHLRQSLAYVTSDMIIEVGGVKFSLNSKQVLKFNDGESKTEIDFGSPTPEELKNKKGTRRLTEYFDESEV